MYPNLHFILKKLIGVDAPIGFSMVQTYGLFLAMTFVVAAGLIYLELKRKYEEGLLTDVPTVLDPMKDLIINTVIAFIFGYKLGYAYQHYDLVLAAPDEAMFSPQGSWLFGLLFAEISAVSGYLTIQKKALKKQTILKKPYHLVGDMIVVAAIFGLLGSKLLALVEVWDDFLKNPAEMLFSGSGIAIYGGLLGGGVALYIYCKIKNINPLHLMDAAAPALLLGYGIGRLGCHFSGDGDWGIVNTAPKPAVLPDWLWAYNYPNNVIKSGIPLENCEGLYYTDAYCYVLPQGVFPTSVYEFLLMVICFSIFWFLRKKIKIWGLLFSIYLVVNGIERFFIEMIRVNDRYDWALGLSQAQMVAIGFMVAGILSGFYFISKKLKTN